MKKNIVFLLILIPIIWISCDGMGHQTIDFRKVENLMPQHPDSALMLLEQIENKENLSRKDKAHYYLLLTEAQDKTFVKHETDSLITIATDYYEETDDLERKAKAWFYIRSFYHLYLCFRKCNSRSPASLQIDDRIFSISSRVELSHSASSRS